MEGAVEQKIQLGDLKHFSAGLLLSDNGILT